MNRNLVIAAAVALAWAAPSDARVTKVIVDSKVSPAFCAVRPAARRDAAGVPDLRRRRASTKRSPAAPSASSTRTTRRTRRSPTSRRRSARRRARGGRVRRHLPHRQADRHVEVERPDVARRAEPRRPHHHQYRPAHAGRRRPVERVAGRQRRRHGGSRECLERDAGYAGQQRVGRHAGDHRHDREDLRPHHQPQRPQRGAAERDGQSHPVLPGRTRPTTRARCSRSAPRRRSTATFTEGRHGAERRLEVLRRRHVRRADAGDHAAGAALPQGRASTRPSSTSSSTR